jgi:hypothetical protein
MSTSTETQAHLSMPLESQRNTGGEISIFLITRLPLPKNFTSPEQQQIKGLNFETIATIYFPPPPWLNNSEYASLQPQPNDDDHDIHSALFSLNLSMYDQSFNPSNWDDTYFRSSRHWFPGDGLSLHCPGSTVYPCTVPALRFVLALQF